MWKRFSGNTIPRLTRERGFRSTALKPLQTRFLSTAEKFEKRPGEFLTSEPLLPLKVNTSYLLAYLRKQNEGIAPPSSSVTPKNASQPSIQEFTTVLDSPVDVSSIKPSSVPVESSPAATVAAVEVTPAVPANQSKTDAYLAGNITLSTLLRGASHTQPNSLDAFRDLLARWAEQRDGLELTRLQPATVEDFQLMKSILPKLSPTELAHAINLMSSIPVSNVPVSPILMRILEKLVAEPTSDQEGAIRQALIGLATRGVTMTEATSGTFLKAVPRCVNKEHVVSFHELLSLLQSLASLGLKPDHLTAEIRRELISGMAIATKLENRRIRYTKTLNAKELKAVREVTYVSLQTLAHSPCFVAEETHNYQYHLVMANLEAAVRMFDESLPEPITQKESEELIRSIKEVIAYITDHLPPTSHTAVYGDRRTRLAMGKSIELVASHLSSLAAWNIVIWTTLVELPLKSLVSEETCQRLLVTIDPIVLAKEAGVKVADMCNIFMAATLYWPMFPTKFQQAFVEMLIQHPDNHLDQFAESFRVLSSFHFSLRSDEIAPDTRKKYLHTVVRKVPQLNTKQLALVIDGLHAAKPGMFCLGGGLELWKVIEKRFNTLFKAEKWSYARSNLAKIASDWGVTWVNLSPTSTKYFAPYVTSTTTSSKTSPIQQLIREIYHLGLLRANWYENLSEAKQSLIVKSLRSCSEKATVTSNVPIWQLIDGFNAMQFAWYQDAPSRTIVESLVGRLLPTMNSIDVAWTWQALANSGARWQDFSAAFLHQLVDVTIQRQDLRVLGYKYGKYLNTDIAAVVLSSFALLGHDLPVSSSSSSSSSSTDAASPVNDEQQQSFVRMLRHAPTLLPVVRTTKGYLYGKEHYHVFHQTWHHDWQSMVSSENHVSFINPDPKDFTRWSMYREKMVRVTRAQLAKTEAASQFTVRTNDDALFPKDLAMLYDFMLVRSNGADNEDVVLVKLHIPLSFSIKARQEDAPVMPHHATDGVGAERWYHLRRKIVQKCLPSGRCVELPVTEINGDGVTEAKKIVASALAAL